MSTATAVNLRTQPPTSTSGVRSSRPLPSDHGVPTVGRKKDKPALESRGERRTLLVGAIIGLALVKEILTRIGGTRVIGRPPSFSRAGGAFSIAVLFGMLKRIGARAAGI